MKRLIGPSLLSLLLTLSCLLAPSHQSNQFTIAFTDPPRWKAGSEALIHVTAAAVYALEDALETATEGTLQVDFKHSGVLGGQIETIDQVLTGTIQATTPALPALSGYAPNLQVLSIPYLWKSPVVAWEVLDSDFGRRLFDSVAQQNNLRILSIFDNGGYRSFTNNAHPIHSTADLVGLKIRTMESPTQMKIVESLEAAPTPIAWTELYSSLQTGVVDGQENSPATVISGSLHEVQKYYTLDRHTLSLAVIVVQEDWFQALPDRLKRDLKIAGRIASIAGRGTAWSNNKLALEFLEKQGMEVYRPTEAEREEFRKLTQEKVLAWMRENPAIDDYWVERVLQETKNAEQRIESW